MFTSVASPPEWSPAQTSLCCALFDSYGFKVESLPETSTLSSLTRFGAFGSLVVLLRFCARDVRFLDCSSARFFFSSAFLAFSSAFFFSNSSLFCFFSARSCFRFSFSSASFFFLIPFLQALLNICCLLKPGIQRPALL